MSKSKDSDTSEYLTSTGLTITLTRVDPIFLQSVANSVKLPKTPVYEVKTAGGRIETHRMDEVAAKQLEGGESIWQAWKDDYAAAQAEQAERIMRALFYMGTACELPSNGWEKKYQFLGINIPDDPDEKRSFYLASELPLKDVVGLTSEISKLTGISEDAIRQSEDAFRSVLSK